MTDIHQDETVPERPFVSFTSADHARIAMAATAWETLTDAWRALLPDTGDQYGKPQTLIRAAATTADRAERLLRAAVVAAHEQGATWTQIGQGLGISKQSAHERFAADVGAFRRALADRLDALAAGTEPAEDEYGSPVVDTGWYAPRLDAWRAQLGGVPYILAPAGQPGELLERLSDPDTAVPGVNGTTARSVDSPVPRCRFTAEATWTDDSNPGEYLVCTLQEGHPGNHQLTITGTDF